MQNSLEKIEAKKNQRVSYDKLSSHTMNFKAAFEAMPGMSVLIDTDTPRYSIVAVTDDYVSALGKTRTELTGKGFLEIFSSGHDYLNHVSAQDLLDSFEYVMKHKVLHQSPVQLINEAEGDDRLKQKYRRASIKPVLDHETKVTGIICTLEEGTYPVNNVTEEERAKRQIEESETRFRNMVQQAPVAMLVLRGENMVFETVNDAMLALLGKEASIIGKPVLECLPEVEAQPVWDIIKRVYDTGKPYFGTEVQAQIIKDGQLQNGYYTFSFIPMLEAGKTVGILQVAVDVTIEVKARLAAQESEARFRSLIKAAPVAIGLFTGRDLIIDMPNQTFINIVGKGDSIIGKPLAEAMPELKDQPFLQILDDVFTSGNMFQTTGTQVNIVQNGVMKHGFYDFSYSPLFDAEGKVYAILDIAIDVTEQVLARKRLQESEQQVRSLVESAPFPIGVYVGKEMRIELANQAIMDAWGKGDDIIGKLYAEVLPELDNQEIFKQLDGVFMTGIPFHAKNQRVDLMVNGKLQPYYFNYSFTPLFDAAGKVYGIMNTAADVTDLNIAKQKVEESGRNLRNIILQAPVAMCILREPNYIVEIANERMLELWGKPAEAIMNKPIFEGLPEAREQGLEELLLHVYATGETYKAFERPVDLPRGNTIQTTYLNFVYDAIFEPDRVISGIIVVAVEVTEQVLARRKIEEVVAQRTKELGEANFQLQETNTELNQFAYIASHDLQEPLRKIKTFTGLMESSLGEVPEKTKIYIDKIQSSIERMQKLINDVLEFSLLSKEKEKFEAVDLNHVLRSVLGDYELLIEQKGAGITSGNLPAIEAIPVQMNQLFTNLISNALKFSSNDRQLEITITAKQLSQDEVRQYKELQENEVHYMIECKDNGIGFDQEYAKQIFAIFQRLHGRSVYEGTGIGLALCKKILSNHHGTIYANSRLNEGASFVVILPESQYNVNA